MKHFIFFIVSFVVLFSSYLAESISLFTLFTILLLGLCLRRLIAFHRSIYTIKYFTLIPYTTFSWVLIGQTLSFFAYGQSNGFDQLLNYELGVGSGGSLDWIYLPLSMAYISLFCAFFSIFSAVPFVDVCEKKITLILLNSISLKSHKLLSQYTWISYVCGVFLLFLVSAGLLGFKGTQVSATDPSSSQALWFPLVRISLSILAVIPVFIFKLERKQSFSHLFLIFALLVGIYVSFIIGRRVFIYQLILSLYSYVWISLAVDNKLPSFKPKVLAISALALYITPQLMTFFQYIRTLKLTDLSLSSLYSRYLEFSQNLELLERVQDSQVSNYITRPLLHSVLAQLTQIDDLIFTGFTDIHDSFLQSLPTLFVGSKTALYGSKSLLVEATGINIDWISSPPTMSYLSFGILGFLLYPLLYVTIYYLYSTLVLSILKLRYSTLILAIFFTFWLDTVIQGMPEGSTISYFRGFVIQSFVILLLFMPILFAKTSRRF